jgi:hypothetical protein
MRLFFVGARKKDDFGLLLPRCLCAPVAPAPSHRKYNALTDLSRLVGWLESALCVADARVVRRRRRASGEFFFNFFFVFCVRCTSV